MVGSDIAILGNPYQPRLCPWTKQPAGWKLAYLSLNVQHIPICSIYTLTHKPNCFWGDLYLARNIHKPSQSSCCVFMARRWGPWPLRVGEVCSTGKYFLLVGKSGSWMLGSWAHDQCHNGMQPWVLGIASLAQIHVMPSLVPANNVSFPTFLNPPDTQDGSVHSYE